MASPPELQMVPEVGIEPTRGYPQGILSPSISSIDHNPGHASPSRTTQKLLIQSRFTNSQYVVIGAGNVESCEKMSHECPIRLGRFDPSGGVLL